MSDADEGSLTAACSVTGMFVLPLVIWLADEQPALIAVSQLASFDKQAWLTLGCWVTAGTIPFFKSLATNTLMKTSGAQVWRISELASVTAIFICSLQMCGAVGVVLWGGMALLLMGRLCCAVDSYQERREADPRLSRTYYSRRLSSRRDSSMEESLAVIEEGLLDHMSAEQANDITTKLTGLVKAYVTRTQCEDLTLLKNMGGGDGIAHMLHVPRTIGLSDPEDIEQRRKLFGVNRLPSRASASFLSLCIDAASDNTLQILMVCGLASIILSQLFGENPQVEWMEGAAIWVAVLVVVLVTAGNDWLKEQQFRQLSAVKDDKNCTVLRDGCPTQVSVFDLVLGDLLQFEAGDELPADCVVISCRGLRMDESSLTGESEMIKKDTYEDCMAQLVDGNARSPRSMQHHFISSPVVLSGTTVNSGSGTAIVIAVGPHSQAGQLYQKLSFDTEATPLQLKLNALAGDIGNFGLICSIIAFFVLVLEYWIIYAYTEIDQRPPLLGIVSSHVHFFVTAITVLISLAYSIGQMLADQNYVRRLGACETMGSANEVCSDKTGTLTRNQMSAVEFWDGAETVRIPSASFAGPETTGVPGFNKRTEKWELVSESIALNSTAYLEKMETMTLNNGQETARYTVKYVGSATECALLEYNDFICGADYAETRRVKGSDLLIAHREEFSSDRKMMTTVVYREGCGESQVRVYVKGAAERVLQLCNGVMTADGQIQKLHQEQKKDIEDRVIGMAREALRTICIAYREFSTDAVPNWKEKQPAPKQLFLVAEQDLICLGIFGIQDPVRDEVPGAVERCHQAGINVRMVTGDNLITAKAIAKKCHIFNEERGDLAMLGPDFTQLVGGVVCQTCRTVTCGCATDAKTAEAEGKNLRVDVIGNMDAFERIWKRLQVLARSQPSDKYVLVTALKQLGQVVAVTGDGTNDAPALKKADVGLAMGITGKEVAKQAADIVMLDDNFQCIVQAVKWGRNVYSNIRRFLQFQLTVNVVAVITTIVCAAVLRDSPLTAVQMLWVNLIMDSFASLALATELPTPDLLKEKPHHRHQSLISRSMALTITTSAVYQLVVMMVLIFFGDYFLPEKEWGYLLPADRSNNDFCEFSDCDPATGPHVGAVVLEHFDWLRWLTVRTHPLTLEQWFLSILIGFVGLLFARIPQCFPRITRIFPEFGMREEDITEKTSLALGLRGRSPSRMNDRCMISTLAVAKKYARRAKVLTISRMKARRGAPQAEQPTGTAVTDAYLPVQVAA
ncbi:LOW QUALITY PROTEIN: Ca2+-ATPase, putative [Eimeria mitis]|uniref:Ca2+-ATPase, putative n=1 Tax=Eimeria mitis TaxID=44415 RepID=U6KFG7_9EIME|nr:LOW QUALITY PROTEIN: Ca2+-ATPase, putative [Eimeria mitis]CDJ34218.1 Ca2+-ATPase, putative [Eimeria mitis]